MSDKSTHLTTALPIVKVELSGSCTKFLDNLTYFFSIPLSYSDFFWTQLIDRTWFSNLPLKIVQLFSIGNIPGHFRGFQSLDKINMSHIYHYIPIFEEFGTHQY